MFCFFRAWKRFGQRLARIEETLEDMMTILDDLRTQIEATTTVERSAITLIEGIADQLHAAIRANDLSEVAVLVAQLKDATDPLAAAVAANTVAAPAPTEPPVA
jgi:molecular chaperone GrpE (heat shock protein)